MRISNKMFEYYFLIGDGFLKSISFKQSIKLLPLRPQGCRCALDRLHCQTAAAGLAAEASGAFEAFGGQNYAAEEHNHMAEKQQLLLQHHIHCMRRSLLEGDELVRDRTDAAGAEQWHSYIVDGFVGVRVADEDDIVADIAVAVAVAVAASADVVVAAADSGMENTRTVAVVERQVDRAENYHATAVVDRVVAVDCGGQLDNYCYQICYYRSCYYIDYFGSDKIAGHCDCIFADWKLVDCYDCNGYYHGCCNCHC